MDQYLLNRKFQLKAPQQLSLYIIIKERDVDGVDLDFISDQIVLGIDSEQILQAFLSLIPSFING